MASAHQQDIAANLQSVETRIRAACVRAGRRRDEVTLVAVSKTRSLADIVAAYRAGVRHLGENRVEEAEAKIPALRQELGEGAIVWHMIGHVQSRKAKPVVVLCDMLHSLDSLHLAARLERFASEQDTKLPVLLEVNGSGEASKYGFEAWDEAHWENVVDQANSMAGYTHLEVRGLMTMAPIVADPELVRPIFRRVRALRDLLRVRAAFSSWDELSMGMTDDFEVAIEEGATLVRIGRAVFGPSKY
jgi:PLP dependent protein